jgi:hypothetical protein
MQVPILSGIYTNMASDFRRSYPKNLVPVIQQTGLSSGYFRPADGIIDFGYPPNATDFDRGGIEWNGTLYRAMGTKLMSFDSTGTVTVLAEIGGEGQVTFDYSQDLLAVLSNGILYYWSGTVLTQLTPDPEMGPIIDFCWVDGYFFVTDGYLLGVTSISDPTVISYKATSEADPDGIISIQKFRNEVYAINRHTIELFNNAGIAGDFPFVRVEGAQVQRGGVGTYTCCVYLDSVAFVGGGRNEQVSVWLASGANTVKIATREIDQILEGYGESVLSQILCEVRVHNGLNHLYIHLPDFTLVYDGSASQIAQEAIWFILADGLAANAQYKAKNFVYAYDKWICGDTMTGRIGYTTQDVSTVWGEPVGWQFETPIFYNEGKGAILHELELVTLSGRAVPTTDPLIWASYTTDGLTYSQERSCRAGRTGQYARRITWMRNGRFPDWRAYRFRGTSDAHIAIARLDASFEPLAW